ncbi:MAG: hypothetical protein M3345_08200 [Actinomycetota bacterium]|nr:hypothetical protein [Actinomycetota bacterium]
MAGQVERLRVAQLEEYKRSVTGRGRRWFERVPPDTSIPDGRAILLRSRRA